MNIAIVLYQRFTALDAIGPYEVLSRLPGASVAFVAAEPGPVHTDNGMLTVLAERSLEDVRQPDIVLVPGGPGDVVAHAGPAVLDWLREADRTSTWTTSVCTGSLILAAAGLLDGRRATSHWLAIEELRRLGAQPVAERVVFDGKLVTAAGVSAGIDMALTLAARIAGDTVAQAIQLGIEYDPQPPFDAGSPDKAPAEVVELLRSLSPRVQEIEAHPPAR
jgi:transcriptional regulator GlxA family with amidase domain